MYLKPITNGQGNYYIEAQTRDSKRTDIIVDYHGIQYVIELKLWHGEEYNKRGEEQLFGYLDFYKKDVGYLLSFNFNKNKKTGIHELIKNGKRIMEVVV
ncbi:MAG: GxxExxY protein [Eubacteriales bacterium]|nr:GxxExxY protein [Eubacteriales bacterium]